MGNVERMEPITNVDTVPVSRRSVLGTSSFPLRTVYIDLLVHAW